MSFVRNNGDTFFKFKIDKKLTEIYEKMPHEKRVSTAWDGNSFYCLPTLTESEKYQRTLREHNVTDNYGAPLYTENKINIAFLRTISGKGQIKVSSQIPLSQIQIDLANIIAFAKTFYREYYQQAKLSASLTIEL